MHSDRDPNICAEAANVLAQYGQPAVPYLMNTFLNHQHWLIRLSILPALMEMDCPAELFELCGQALQNLQLSISLDLQDLQSRKWY